MRQIRLGMSLELLNRIRMRNKGRTKVMSSNTIRLHRVLRSTPEKIYKAFLDADAMAKWLPPNGFTGRVHQMDAKVGGSYRMSFTNFTTGNGHSFGGTYVELIPHEGSATPVNSMIQICLARCRRPSH